MSFPTNNFSRQRTLAPRLIGRQRGFLLLTAVVLIVVVALILSVMVYLSAASTRSSGKFLAAQQALFIAGSGLERGTRFLVSPVLAERLTCAAVTGNANLTNVAFAQGQFTVNAGNAGTSYYPVTTLRLALGSADNTVPVNSLAGFAPAWRVLIDREAIDYSKTEPANDTICGGAGRAPCLVGAQRGRDGSVAVAHVTGAPVGQYQCDLRSQGGVPDLANARGKRLVQKSVQLQEGWAVGANGVLFRWNDTTWLNAASPLATQLNSVSMLSYADGWAVGNQSGGEVILRWTGGPNWTRVGPTGPIPNTNLNSVYCVASNDCWIVGNQSGGEVILRWNGAAWNQVGPSTAIPNVSLRSVYCTKSDDCWIVGDQSGGELLLHWDGTAWARLPASGALPNQNLRGICIVGSRQRPQAAWREVFQ
ncbi:MAG: hypothetical protein HY274_05415 [Gammaproteobacteria bacterium]|nr:hypothetical protein [Gammaproteobacteria bacterium]